jgi:hypothetical protein
MQHSVVPSHRLEREDHDRYQLPVITMSTPPWTTLALLKAGSGMTEKEEKIVGFT